MRNLHRLLVIGAFGVASGAGLAGVRRRHHAALRLLACDMNVVPYDPYHQTCGIPNQIPTAPGAGAGGGGDHRVPRHPGLPVAGRQRAPVGGGAPARHHGFGRAGSRSAALRPDGRGGIVEVLRASSASLARAREQRLFTVPSGTPSIRAVSATE